MLLLLLFLSTASSGCLVWETLQRGELLSALAAQDAERFFSGMWRILFVILLIIPLLSFKTYVQDKIGLYWRRWLSDRFIARYFTNQTFYQLSIHAQIDNPDQRITEDLRNFTQQSLNFLVILSDSTLQLIGFIGVLWVISKPLMAILLTYAITGTVVTMLIFGRVLIGINFEQLKREANFRYGLVRIRENAESVALYQGQGQEFAQAKERFLSAFLNYNRLIRWQFSLTMFQNGYQYITFILPFIVLAPRIFTGELEVGAVVQSQAAFERIGFALGIAITQFDQLSAFVAGVDRLDALRETSIPPPEPSIKTAPAASLAIKNLTLYTPTYQTKLIQDLSLAVNQPLLIVGSSGVGKSSLLRAITGLWQTGTGVITRPDCPELLFLPQRPYMILGSLRQQLLYPNFVEATDEQLLQLLEQVQLPKLVTRYGGLEATEDWSKMLSIGEQQRLTFARVLLHQPQYALLDEATSSLDTSSETHLYQQLSTSKIIFVSVGHRPTLLQYHQQILRLRSDQSWQLSSTSDYRSENGDR